MDDLLYDRTNDKTSFQFRCSLIFEPTCSTKVKAGNGQHEFQRRDAARFVANPQANSIAFGFLALKNRHSLTAGQGGAQETRKSSKRALLSAAIFCYAIFVVYDQPHLLFLWLGFVLISNFLSRSFSG